MSDDTIEDILDDDLEDDEEQGPATVKAEDGVLYKDLKKHVPEIGELLRMAKKFTDAHRYVLQEMIIRSSVKIKKFYMMFIHFAVARGFKCHPTVTKFIDADASQLRSLAVQVVKTINDNIHDDFDFGNDFESDDDNEEPAPKKHKRVMAAKEEDEDKHEDIGCGLGLKLVLTTEENTGKEYVVLVSELQNSDCIKEEYGMTPGELALWWLMVDEAVHNYGRIEQMWVKRVGPEVNNSLTQLRADRLIGHLIKTNWLVQDRKYVRLSPRAITELTPYIRRKYQVPPCAVCQQLVVQTQFSTECEQCHCHVHSHCWKRLVEIDQSDTVDCSGLGCRAKLNKAEVEEVVQEKIAFAETRAAVHSDPASFKPKKPNETDEASQGQSENGKKNNAKAKKRAHENNEGSEVDEHAAVKSEADSQDDEPGPSKGKKKEKQQKNLDQFFKKKTSGKGRRRIASSDEDE